MREDNRLSKIKKRWNINKMRMPSSVTPSGFARTNNFSILVTSTPFTNYYLKKKKNCD